MPKLFQKSANRLPLQIIVYLCVVACAATAGVDYYMTPKYTRVGYAPIQPVPYSHAKHVGELGLDCRYCHSTIDTAGAAVPTSQTCMNCHSQIRTASPALALVRESFQTGQADPVGARPRDAELRLLRPLDPPEPGDRLRRVPRQDRTRWTSSPR